MPGFLIDSSAWIAASFERHEHHEPAVAFLSTLTERKPAYLCRATEQSWLRLLTTPAIHRHYKSNPFDNRTAIDFLDHWSTRTNIQHYGSDPEGTRELWLKLAAHSAPSPKIWMDAYLAAFAIRASLVMVTIDSDFTNYQTEGLELHLLE